MVQTEAQRREKAKYNAKLKESEEYKADMAQRSQYYYQKNKEKPNETLKNIMKLIKKRLINISKKREKEIKLNLLFLNWNL